MNPAILFLRRLDGMVATSSAVTAWKSKVHMDSLGQRLFPVQIINDDTEKLPHFPIPQIGALSLHHTATTGCELAASAQCPRSGLCYVEVSHGPGLGLVPPPASTSAQL